MFGAFFIARAGLRAAGRASNRPRQWPPKQWPALGKIVFLFFFFGVLCEICGWKPVLFTTLGLIGVGVVIALPAIASQKTARTSKPPADPLAGYFSDKGSSK